jgi:hypothetical protein
VKVTSIDKHIKVIITGLRKTSIIIIIIKAN